VCEVLRNSIGSSNHSYDSDDSDEPRAEN